MIMLISTSNKIAIDIVIVASMKFFIGLSIPIVLFYD